MTSRLIASGVLGIVSVTLSVAALPGQLPAWIGVLALALALIAFTLAAVECYRGTAKLRSMHRDQ